jgi:hypothetical protein
MYLTSASLFPSGVVSYHFQKNMYKLIFFISAPALKHILTNSQLISNALYLRTNGIIMYLRTSNKEHPQQGLKFDSCQNKVINHKFRISMQNRIMCVTNIVINKSSHFKDSICSLVYSLLVNFVRYAPTYQLQGQKFLYSGQQNEYPLVCVVNLFFKKFQYFVCSNTALKYESIQSHF